MLDAEKATPREWSPEAPGGFIVATKKTSKTKTKPTAVKGKPVPAPMPRTLSREARRVSELVWLARQWRQDATSLLTKAETREDGEAHIAVARVLDLLWALWRRGERAALIDLGHDAYRHLRGLAGKYGPQFDLSDLTPDGRGWVELVGYAEPFSLPPKDSDGPLNATVAINGVERLLGEPDGEALASLLLFTLTFPYSATAELARKHGAFAPGLERTVDDARRAQELEIALLEIVTTRRARAVPDRPRELARQVLGDALKKLGVPKDAADHFVRSDKA